MIKKNIPNIVVPTNRDINYVKVFLDNWKKEFEGCHLIIIEDRQKKILTDLLSEYNFSNIIYDWEDIDNELKDLSWIIPRKTDCIRSFGFYKAWQNKPNMIITLDDDTSPQNKHIETFYKKLYLTEYNNHKFYNTLKHGLPRGTYKGLIGCDLIHGGWLDVPDLSAEEQIKNSFTANRVDFNEGLIPIKTYFSMCGMNIAWKPYITKYMYFGLQGNNYPIDRCGDIWAGYYLVNKGCSVYTGEPFCYHNRKSNVWNNLVKEKKAEIMSKQFIDWIENKLSKNSDYWDKLKKAYIIWENLFKD